MFGDLGRPYILHRTHVDDERSLLRRPSAPSLWSMVLSARAVVKILARNVNVILCSRRDGGVPTHAVRTWWFLLEPTARSEAPVMKCSARCRLLAFFKKDGWDSAPRRIFQSTADAQTTAPALVHVLHYFGQLYYITGGTTLQFVQPFSVPLALLYFDILQ